MHKHPAWVIGASICKALGISPTDVVSIDLHIAAGDDVTVTVSLRPSEGFALADEIRRFRIVPEEVTPDG